MARVRTSAPSPPYSAGTESVLRPSRDPSRTRSQLKARAGSGSRSPASAAGMICSMAKVSAISRSSCCRGVRLKSIIGFLRSGLVGQCTTSEEALGLQVLEQRLHLREGDPLADGGLD